MVKSQIVGFSLISREQSNRFDVDFLSFQMNSDRPGYLDFDDLFDVVEKEKVLLPEEYQYCEIGNVKKNGDIEPVILSESVRDENNESLFKKIGKGDIIYPALGDVLISSVRPNLKKVVYIDKEKKGVFFTKAFIHLRPKRQGLILYHLLRSIFFNNLIAVSRQGKGYPTLKTDDLRWLKFDKHLLDTIYRKEEAILPVIEKTEQEIKRLNAQIRKPQEIVDEVFADEFGYDLQEIIDAKRIKVINAYLNNYAKGRDLRFDFRFHSAAVRKAEEILLRFSKKRVCDFLSEPIKLGSGISPDYYDDENGEAYYLTMATIKNWRFETEEARKVSSTYWNLENKKNSVRKDDVIIARSGEGTIGKVAIIENEENEAIFCDFTMRVRFKKYCPYFAYYFFRTDLFQTLIENNKKGLGNNTNIFPGQLKEFPLPDISITRQEKLVSIIKSQLDLQNERTANIESKRDKIAFIIQESFH